MDEEFLVGSGGWKLQDLCIGGLGEITVPMFFVDGNVRGISWFHV